MTAILLAASLVSACTKEQEEETALKEEGIVLTVSTGTPELATKTGEGRVDWNENKITSVYYFIYKEGVHDQAPSVKGFFAGLDLNGSNPTKTWSIPVSSKTILEDLFPTGVQKCHAFVIANPTPEMASILEGDPEYLTLDDLHTYCFYSNLKGIQDKFVMTYEGDVDLISRTGGSDKVVARIDAQLKRLAVKLSMHAKVVPNFIDPVSGEWVPEINGLKVSFHNALSLTNFAGDFTTLNAHQSDYFDTDEAGFTNTRSLSFKNSSGTIVEGTVSDTSVPMYSYPMKWEFADRDEPYLFVELPWTRYWTDSNGNHQNTQSCYYKIMFSIKRVDANQWYDVNITLDALGSFNKVEPTQSYLYENYMVLDWNDAYAYTETNVDADVKEARYLVVEQNNYSLFDQERLSIPFSSSHECDLEIVSAVQEDLKSGISTNLATQAASWFRISPTGSVIEFEHALNNTLTSDLDIAPYEITVRIKHADNETYNETVHIIQNPAITVTKKLNRAVSPNSSGNLEKSDANGYVWINNEQKTGSTNIFAVTGASYMNPPFSEDNSCPYIYEIQVRALTGDKYVLRDPRSTTINNLSGTPAFASAIAHYDGASNRSLRYYYPTDETAEGKKSISPKFRIASSFGKCWTMSHADAKRRCAAYQEDGYPAGRWRVPTGAEIEFCVTLSSYQKIQVLFDKGSSYWCASGSASVSNSGIVTVSDDKTGNNPVRCVYDAWYWDEVDRIAGRSDRDATKNTFTWGDEPR